MVTYRNKNGELLKEGGSMKTGKRKNQKYISAMLIAAMSVGNVTGVLAEPVNTVAVSKEQGSEVLETAVPTENQEISIVRGESLQLDKPESFSENVTWSAKFLKKDGTFLRNAGYSKIKRELKEGETDGTRKAGDASAEHLLKVEADENGNAVITGENKGNVVVVAQDDQGKTAQEGRNFISVSFKTALCNGRRLRKNSSGMERVFNWQRFSIRRRRSGSLRRNQSGGRSALERLCL
jgi:hyaluronate lyase